MAQSVMVYTNSPNIAIHNYPNFIINFRIGLIFQKEFYPIVYQETGGQSEPNSIIFCLIAV
jgi:hypothetical protein